MWLALDHAPADGEGLEGVLAQLEAIRLFTEELGRRFTAVGIDGIAGALELYRRLKATLDAVPLAEIERRMGEAQALGRTLGELAQSLERIRRLKTLLGA